MTTFEELRKKQSTLKYWDVDETRKILEQTLHKLGYDEVDLEDAGRILWITSMELLKRLVQEGDPVDESNSDILF